MERPVEETLEALRQHFQVATDAELARKLRIDKSTISSWKARNRVPDRYRGILQGDTKAAAGVSPLRWSEHESAAFDLALFRLARIIAAHVDLDDYAESLSYFSHLAATDLWLMQNDCQGDLAAFGELPHTALALAIHGDLKEPDASLQRDVERLKRASTASGYPAWRRME